MSELSLSICPICHAQGTLSHEKMEVRGRSHEWYECTECGSALLWLGDDQWAYQKVGREDKAHLLKKPMTEEELLALLPEQEEAVPAAQEGEAPSELDEEGVTSLFSRDWPEYDQDPFAFLFQGASEEEAAMAAPTGEEEPEEEEEEEEEEEWEPGPPPAEELAEAVEPGPPSEAGEKERDRDAFAGLFAGEWDEAEEAEAAPPPTADDELPGEAEPESSAMFSRAWFEETEAAEFTPPTEEGISDLEDVPPGPGIGDDWPEQDESAPTLVAEDEQLALEEDALIPEARGDLPSDIEGAAAVTVRRDLPEERRERSAVGRVIPWLLALVVIAFLFLVGIAVYQVVTGSSLF
jgi:hypothetical protein